MCSSWLFSHSLCVCVLSLFPTNLHTLPYENLLIKFYCFYLFNTKIVFCLFAYNLWACLIIRCAFYHAYHPLGGFFSITGCWFNKLQWCGSPQYFPLFSLTFSTEHFFCANRGFFTFFCQSYITSGIETHIRIQTILKCWPLIYRQNDEDDKAKLHL